MVSKNKDLLDYDESKKKVLQSQVYDILSKVLPEDILRSWSGDIDPLKIIAVVEAAKLRSMTRVLKEAVDMLKFSKENNRSELLELMNIEPLIVYLSEIEQDYLELYKEIDKVIPIMDTVKELKLDKTFEKWKT